MHVSLIGNAYSHSLPSACIASEGDSADTAERSGDLEDTDTVVIQWITLDGFSRVTDLVNKQSIIWVHWPDK